jgi:hypothetical protein
MKKILLILLMFPMFVFGQTYYRIYADTTIFGSIGSGKNEIVIKNRTKDSIGGFLSNKGNGVTEFKKIRSKKINDSTYVVLSGTAVLGDTIKILSTYGGGGSDSLILNRTYLDLVNQITDSTLTKGVIYKITDRGDRGLFFHSISNYELSKSGQRLMLCPAKYNLGGDTFGNNWIGVWGTLLTNADVAVNDLTIRGGLVWKNLTGNIGTAPDDFTLDATNWVLVPKSSFSNGEYTEKQFDIVYDFERDWIQWQMDGLGNGVGFIADLVGYDPTSVTDWLSAETGGINISNNHTALLGIFNNTGLSPLEIANNISKEIKGNNLRGSVGIAANRCNIINYNSNTGDIIYNTTPVIQNLPPTIGNVETNSTTAGGSVSRGVIDGTESPFDTLNGNIIGYQFNGTYATDNSVAKIVGVNANGETKYVDKSSIGGETIVELGTITYTDINSAPADPVFTVALDNSGLTNKYFTGFFIKINTAFDAPSGKEVSIRDFSAGNIGLSSVSTYYYSLSDLSEITANLIGISPTDMPINGIGTSINSSVPISPSFSCVFVQSGYVNNPQDYTAGSVTIYAITKPFPF